eukprot:465747_1
MKSITIFLLCALLEYTASHYARITKSNITCADVGEYQMMSYHIHCLYDVDNAQQVETSNKLRREFEHQFFPEGIPDCTPEMESLLLVYDTQGPANESMKACNLGTMPPGAPFYQTNWAYFVNLESIGYMIPWLMQFINKKKEKKYSIYMIPWLMQFINENNLWKQTSYNANSQIQENLHVFCCIHVVHRDSKTSKC